MKQFKNSINPLYYSRYCRFTIIIVDLYEVMYTVHCTDYLQEKIYMLTRPLLSIIEEVNSNKASVKKYGDPKRWNPAERL